MEQAGEPIIVVFADGRVMPGAGCTVGQLLDAIETARHAVLGVVLRREEPRTPAVPAPDEPKKEPTT